MNYREALREGCARLEQEKIRDAAVDAGYLLEYTCNLDRAAYLMRMNEEMPETAYHDFMSMIEKRAQHVPLQYITGQQEFYGYTFKVTPDVLIPRLDTEVLVETILGEVTPGMSVLDLCTGSGCILISLLKQNPELIGTGSDISKAALNIAKENASALGVRTSWLKSDMFEEIEGFFDVIVSNPPYIPSLEIYDLDPEVRDFEPKGALDGDADGLKFYRVIAEESPKYLNPGGKLFLEIGCDQGEAVSGLLADAGFSKVQVKKDLAGLDRIVIGYL